MQEEIANATVVSTIKEKLPPSLKTRWFIEVCCDEMQPSTIQEGASRKIAGVPPTPQTSDGVQ